MKKLGTLLILLAAGMFIVGTTGCGDKKDKDKDKTTTTDKKDKDKKDKDTDS